MQRGPSALAAFVEASAGAAAGAAERGDLAEARRVLERALAAVEAADEQPGLRVVAGVAGDERGRP